MLLRFLGGMEMVESFTIVDDYVHILLEGRTALFASIHTEEEEIAHIR